MVSIAAVQAYHTFLVSAFKAVVVKAEVENGYIEF